MASASRISAKRKDLILPDRMNPVGRDAHVQVLLAAQGRENAPVAGFGRERLASPWIAEDSDVGLQCLAVLLALVIQRQARADPGHFEVGPRSFRKGFEIGCQADELGVPSARIASGPRECVGSQARARVNVVCNFAVEERVALRRMSATFLAVDGRWSALHLLDCAQLAVGRIRRTAGFPLRLHLVGPLPLLFLDRRSTLDAAARSDLDVG